jgi:hypothetical protein
MVKTPNNIHLFLSIGQSVPINYFNPPRDCDYIIAFQITPARLGHFASYCDKFHFRKKMGGWVLENIIKSNMT